MRAIESPLLEKMTILRTPSQILPNEPASYGFTGYHTTLVDNWLSIRRSGLIPGKEKPAGQTWMGTYSGKGIYLHLSVPLHEIDVSIDEFDNELLTITIEIGINLPPNLVVADEDAGRPIDTYKTIKEKGPIAVGVSIPTSNIRRVHLLDTPQSRIWADKNLGRFHAKWYKN